MGKCILVTGGARSGKSSFSEELAKSYGTKVLYIATAVAFDKEMKDRIRKHQEARPKGWTTIEDYKDIAKVILNNGDKYNCILLDCITVMLTNQLLEYFNYNMDYLKLEDYNKAEVYLINEVNQMLDAIAVSDADAILVTNELGWGIVPENLMSRAFRDICGRINQILGRRVDEVYLTVCGIPMKIKG